MCNLLRINLLFRTVLFVGCMYPIYFLTKTLYVEGFIQSILKEKAPTYYLDYSKQAGERYYVNHCKCGAKLGDFFLHSEPEGSFMIISEDDLENITMIDLNIKEPINLNANSDNVLSF